MTVDQINIFTKKAETKNNGIYSFKGCICAVKDGRFIAYVDNRGNVLSRQGAFNYQIGDYTHLERWDWKSEFTKWFKKQL